MIKVKGRIATFTGKDLKWLKDGAKRTGLSEQDFFTAKMWEAILRQTEAGLFNAKA